jgi:integrase
VTAAPDAAARAPVDLLAAYAAHLRLTGAAEMTISTRLRTLRRLERQAGPLLTLTRHDLVAWLGQHPRASTRSTLQSYLRSFYGWAVLEEFLDVDPTRRIPTVKTPRAVPRPVPTDELVAALAAAPPRERAWLLLMAYAGLRTFEVAAYRREHAWRGVDGTWWLRIPRGKGGNDQQVPLPAWVAEELQRAPDWSITAQTVQRNIPRLFRSVGSKATAHQCRHWYATAALRSTNNLRVVQEMMRHATPATTARYTLVSSSEATAAAEGLPRL